MTHALSWKQKSRWRAEILPPAWMKLDYSWIINVIFLNDLKIKKKNKVLRSIIKLQFRRYLKRFLKKKGLSLNRNLTL